MSLAEFLGKGVDAVLDRSVVPGYTIGPHLVIQERRPLSGPDTAA